MTRNLAISSDEPKEVINKLNADVNEKLVGTDNSTDDLPDAVIYTIRYLCASNEQSWVIWNGIDDNLAKAYIEKHWRTYHDDYGDGGAAYIQILYTPVNSDNVSEHITYVVVADELFINI